MESFDDLYAVDKTLSHLPSAPVRKAPPSQIDFEIEFFAGILEKAPHCVEILRLMAGNLAAKGDHLQSLELDRRLTILCPDDPLAHYNLACSSAVVGLVDAALQALERALARGYDDIDYLFEDRDLDAVRQDPRFVRLLERHLAH